MKNLNKAVKFNKKILFIIALLVLVITTIVAGIGNIVSKKGISSNDARMQFGEITEDDYKTESDNVKFMVYFLHDNKKVNGTANRIGYSDTMYFDLKITEGTLENAKIQIASHNYYLETNLMSDSVISQNYVSKNTKEIDLNNLSGNIDKTFEASVKSGDYEFTTSIADAIGKDISNYNKETTITFTADYTDTAGQKTQISKEVPLTICWYGEVNCDIPEKVYGSDNLIQKYRLSDSLDVENNEMTIEFNVATQETENEVILNKSYIEGTIPLINDIAPTNVIIEGENIEYTYDQDSRKFTASRTANIDGNIVTEQAYSGIYAQSEINYRYNEYRVKATYPIDAYQLDEDEYINIDIPVTAHYEGVNGEKSNDITKTINVTYSNLTNEETGFDVSVGRNVLYPEERQVVSKHNVLLGYGYNNSNTNLWQTYYTKWNIVTNQEETANNVVLTDNAVEDKFIKSDGTEIENNGYITNKGIAFTNPVSALGLDGWIKVYDDETDELLHTFTADDWSAYDMLNPYEYGKDVKYIRIETSEVSENSFVIIYNIKQINTGKMVDAFSKNEVEDMKYVQTSFNGQILVDGKVKSLETDARANFEEEISVVNFDISEGDIDTQKSNNIQLEISPNMTQYNTCTWSDEQYLIKFPSDIINVTINDVTINNADGVSISDYYKYTEDGSIFIKIEMSGNANANYQLLLDCAVETNPKIKSKKADIELYTYNKENNLFYETEISKDIYDINNNTNTEEKIGKKTKNINILRPETLLSNESTTIEGETIYNPLIAMVENSDRTAKIDIELQNNHKDAISDIKLLGKIPYEGNTYQQTGENLASTYTAQLISDGINLPEELAKRATIYYSEQENVTDDPTDEASGWVQNTDDYSNVKNFLILFNSYQMEPAEELKISYDIKIPDDAAYNEVAYSTHTIYYSEHNESEIERKTADINKLGFNIARRFNFELTIYSRQDNSPIQGASFRITEIGNRLNSMIVETNAEGKITIPDLLLEKNYTIQEIGVPDEYILDSNVIEFRAYEENGELKLNIFGQFEEEPEIDQDNALVSATLYNEVKYDLDITNLNDDSKGVVSTFSLEGRGETQEARTDKNGKLVFEGLYPDQEYILKQTYSKGYYIEQGKEIRFKISRGENGLEINEDTSGLLSIQTESGKIKPTVKLTLNSEKIPTYNLKVVLYENESIIPLENSNYTITGGGKEDGESYTTDAKGSFTVKDLYAYVEGKNESAEYTLKQTNPPTGYALSEEEVKFKVTKNPATQELTLSVTEGTIREDYTIENNTVTISLDSRKLFKITTIDGENTELLPGVKVVIKESVIIDNKEVYQDPTDEYGNVLGEEQIINGESCRVFTTNENGEIEEPLKDGIYKLVKIEVPEGYELEEDEEDRTYFVGIGETRGVEVETSFRDPLLMANEFSREPDQYFVAGREDGKAMYYHNGEISIINDENQIEKTISSDHVYQILTRENGFDVLTDSSIIRYNDNLDVINTYNLISGMRYFDRDEDGSYVVTGSFEGNKTISGASTTSGSSISINSIKTGSWFWEKNTVDIFVMKVNSSGKVESLVNIGGTGEDIPTYIKVMDDGDYVVSSHMTSSSIEASMSDTGSSLSGTFTDSFFIMNSDTMKVSQITSVKTNRGNDVATGGNLHRALEGKDGAIYYTGQLTGSITFSASETVSGKSITVRSTGSSDAYIVKYNTAGKVVWAINVGGIGTDHLYSAEITTDGGILLGGDSENGRITVSGDKTSSGMDISTEPISDNAGTWRGIAIKVDDDGRVVWANEFGYSTDEGCYAVSGFTENSYALCGFETLGISTPVFIRVDEAVKKSEISEVEGIEIPSLIERYNITTSVNGVGGTITGQNDELVETVKYGEDSTKEIMVIPNKGYEILSIIVNGEKISFTPDENGAVTLEKFTNVTEDINIIAEFSNNTSKIIVHHYLLETENTKIAEDDVLVGIVGTEYTTGPKIGLVGYKLATNEKGEYVITGNPSGTYGEYDQEINYYYVEQDVKVTVNHFIEGTTTPLSQTIVTEYKKGQTYTTDVAIDIPEEYELVKIPSNATGIIDESEIVVTYYYRLKPTYQYKIEYYFDGQIDDSLTETGEAIEDKVIDSYTDKVKDGYVFEKTENYPLTISTNEEENIIKVYYKAREDLSYKIEYYYDGIIDDEKTIIVENVRFGTVISEFTNKAIEGYQFEKTENYPLTVSTDNEANVIKVYYTIRKDLYYTVNYYEQGTENKLSTSKEVGGNTYNAVITEEPIDIEGYNKVSDRAQSIVIGVNEEENVINFYYTKRTDLSYTVNYIEQGTNEKIADSKQVDNQTFKDSVTEETIEISGYYAVEPTEQTITIEVENNIINFYYQKRTDIEYTVEYYYDNKLDNDKTEIYTATFKDVIEEYEDKNITGYKFEKTENLPLTISADEKDNVIKVYYVKDTFKYNVEYYYDGEINEGETEEYTATFQDEITEYEDKNITGYKLEKTENLPLTITENPDNNVIKVYYIKDTFNYTVEYYYDGKINDSKTENLQATFKDVIEKYEDKNITGYKLEKTENLPLTISANEKDNIIKVYYAKDIFKYTVQYYYDGILNEENTEEYTATFQDKITEYEDKNITGYKLDKTENLPLTVTENAENNIIKVYYVKDQFSYTVEYYYDNVKDEALTENYTATYQDVIESYIDKVKDGYRLKKVEGMPLTITENSDNNVIRVYYERKDTKVIVKYLEKDTNKVLDESANYEIPGKVFDEYETEQKEFTEYNFVEATDNTTGTMTEEPIEVIYYYVLKTPYLTDEEISKNGTVMIENLDSEITYNISYKVNLQDYMGQAQIKMVDTLPYAIDTSKSSLDSGEYNPENNTITWVETIGDIYSYENRNNEIEINKTITVVYLGLEQETTSIENRVTAKIKTQTPEKEFVEKEATSITTTGFTVNIPVSKIWDDEGNKLGNRSNSVIFKITGSDGSEYSKELIKPGTAGSTTMQYDENKWNDIFENLPKYDSNRNEIVYTLSEEEKTEGDLKYYDTSINQDTKEVTNTDKYGKVTVHYYIQNVDGTTTTNRVPNINGTEISDVIIEGKEGDSYTVSEAQNVNDKYELVEEKLPPSEGIIQKYNEEEPQEVIEGHVDDIYNTNTDYRRETISKDGKTYTLVQDSGNTEGQMTVSDIVVTYYYLQHTKATVRYVEGNPETGEIVKDLEASRTEEGLVGDEFVTNEKAFIGYRLIKSPEKATIKMTKEEQILIYYYEPVYAGLVENHIDDRTGKVLYTEVHQIQVGQNYEISSKEFEGYDLVETKLPENSTGIMEEELVTVNYYYIKKAVLEVNYVNVLTKEPLTEKTVDNTKHEGDLYTTEEKEFIGYDLVEVPANSKGTMEVRTDADGNIVNNKTVVTYYYAQKAQVEEHHIDILTNDEIENPTIHDGHVGDEYNISSKEFLSYALVIVDEEGNNMLPENNTGTMTEEKIVVKYYYNQPAKVIVHYVDRESGKELEETNEEGKLQSSQIVIEGQKYDEYNTKAKDFTYYTLVERPLEEQGKMKVEITKDENGNDILVNTIDVCYYYEPKPFNIAVDKLISKIIVNGEEQNIGNDKLTRVEIYRKNVDDTDVKVEYTIKVKNTGKVDGIATIRENIPEGMSLVNNDGTWEEQDGYIEKVITDIKAGETKEYKITLSWNKGNNNLGEKDNTVEIIKTGNIPGFKEQNVDDNSSTARVLINVSTGSVPWPLVIALIALIGLEGVTLSYARVLTNKQKKARKTSK
ncbi:MAG: MucBP domain-containing protein [Clostridium sp.]|nr:MucBP domain-containing protein [Clostridium sp.]